jgi:hypothetical protein
MNLLPRTRELSRRLTLRSSANENLRIDNLQMPTCCIFIAPCCGLTKTKWQESESVYEEAEFDSICVIAEP